MVRSLGKAMWRFLKTRNHDVIKVGLLRRTESRALKRDVNMHTRVHRGIDPCSQEAEATKCPWTGKRISAARAVPAVGGRSALESARASVCPSIHTFIPTLSPRVRLHPPGGEMFACSRSQRTSSAGSWSEGPQMPTASLQTRDGR